MRFISHRGDTKRDWLQGLRQPKVNLATCLLSPIRISAMMVVWRRRTSCVESAKRRVLIALEEINRLQDPSDKFKGNLLTW